ncbi:lactonase family protein [Marinivivus vitaminiproducens]|uniref:lactonase family protein n=1 Tax=Marinivivus vitaminiproducens TaxID=3035935 RepID=UPI00279E906B|nr:lactonase family protein [Geminicoccaceae bacterium SCSIO 64248]
MAADASAPIRLLIGTYTKTMPHVQGTAEGIYRATLDGVRGRVEVKDVIVGVDNPSWVTVDPTGRFLYAAQESTDAPELHAYSLRDDGVTFLGALSTHGADPCHIGVDPHGRFLYVANYSSGSFAAARIGPDGAPIAPAALFQHEGSGPNRSRQAEAHVHCTQPTPDGDTLLVCDLGTDTVAAYRCTGNGVLPQPVAVARTAPGAGPRHIRIDPAGDRAYVVCELACTVSAYRLEPDALTETATVPTLARPHTEADTCAGIALHPNGRFVYASTRGDDSIAVIAREGDDLRRIGTVPSGGRTPRDIAIDPTGRFLLAANQDSSTVAVFAIDASSGALTMTGEPASVPSPACIAFPP